MIHALTSGQLALLRQSKSLLVLPPRALDGEGDRSDVYLLLLLKLVKAHDLGFRITANGSSYLRGVDESESEARKAA